MLGAGLLEMGVEAIHPMDPPGVDYRDYKKRFGSCLSLFGNIDIMWPLVQGTPADVERDVQEHMDALKPAGRWVRGAVTALSTTSPTITFWR